MTNYEKLVEALRCCGDVGCHKCPYQKHIHEHFCWTMAMHDAAAAIEALQAEVDKWTFNATLEQSKAIANFESYCKLKAQLPKRGEWIYHPKDAIEMMFTLPKCSICGHESSDALNYCPNCGAKMEAQE